MPHLVIVESPAKVKKIQQFLGNEFDVDSCVGHIRDLPAGKSQVPDAIKDKPWADYAVDIEHDFKPYYVTIHGKGKVLQKLQKKLKDADILYLATDEDREGESISWHLVESLDPKVPVKRMVFNEITRDAVHEALKEPRDLDMDLVQAQETRRILDRLYGYALSPLLWKKIGGNLSAGRVQSVAVRLVVSRERERFAFRSASYWGLDATLWKDAEFPARLTAVSGTRVATGKDFDEKGRLIEGRDVVHLQEEDAKGLQSRLAGADWEVTDVERQERQNKPRPPFITSSLQQDANNRLNLGAAQTMRIAQRLYENGFITYMRTDSTALSKEGLEGARAAVVEEFGEAYAKDAPRFYGKKAKGAQEAHEAIRPAGAPFQHPDRCGLSGQEQALYRLIWQRTLASQMPNERYTATTVTVAAEEATFTANGKHIDFPGWRAVYPAQKSDETELPAIETGDHPECRGLEAEGHETKPPARFTEATLVRALEENGVGRPSTYAAILGTIQDRGYVVKKGKALVPTFTAFAVTGLLETHFPKLVDPAFTARMEEALDEIAAGEADWVPFLRDFFLGEDGLQRQIEERLDSIDPEQARRIDLGDLPFDVKIGRYGPYVEKQENGETVTASLPEDITPDELDEERVERLIQARKEGPQSIGTDPETGKPVYVMEGRFGPYYQLGEAEGKQKPPRASLPKGKKPEDADLDEALFLLSLPRVLGEHPAGGTVEANIGRYGPYVAHRPEEGGKPDFRSLPDVDAVGRIDLDEALEILKQPKGRRGQQVIKDLGDHPDDGKPVQVLKGRYGPYVKHDKTNATIPKDADPEGIDMQAAVRLLAERKGKKKG